MSSTNSPTRRGLAAIIFCMDKCAPVKSSPRAAAILPIMVKVQEAKAAASKSVGEKQRPLPPLSGGKSVFKVVPVGP